MAPARPVLERFLEKIGKPDAEGCCRWLASHNRKEARKKNENFGDFAKVISSVSGISSKCPPSRRGRSRARSAKTDPQVIPSRRVFLRARLTFLDKPS